MNIRTATLNDAAGVHAFGLQIPELRVSAHEFMSIDELRASIADPLGVFLVAETEVELALAGFAYARIDDLERGPSAELACFVYLAVDWSERRRGVGDNLCKRILAELYMRGVKRVYTWAHPTSGVVKFLHNRGFLAGQDRTWMSRDLPSL